MTGTQGVLIPEANVRHLILHPEVIAAVREDKFHIYPVRTVEEGLELLTGMPAGSPGEAGTVMGTVDRALRDMATALKGFGSAAKESRKRNGEED